MAVVAVGDFDKAAIEALIKAHFGAIPRVRVRSRGRRIDVPDQPGTRYTVVTDPGADRRRIVDVSSKMAARDQSTVGAYRQQMVERLFGGMLVGAARRDDAEAGRAVPARRHRSRGCSSAPKRRRRSTRCVTDGGVERGLDGAASPRPSASRASASPRPSSIAQKLDILRALRARRWPRRTSSPSGRWPTSTSATSCRASRFPASSTSTALYQRFLPEITLAEVNALAQGLDARSQPRRRRQRAGEGRRRRCRPRRSSPRCISGRRRSDAHRLRRRRQHAAAARTRRRRRARSSRPSTQGRARHHRVEAVERRPRRAQADDVQAGRDPVPRRQPRRHVARAATRTSSRPRPPAQVVAAGGLGKLEQRSICSKTLAGKTARVSADIGETEEGAQRRRARARISRRCSS